ncbi:hypothetical protein HMN09_00785800 [Mycena chlorophos]|uniref:Uncharacterized protein n=1 Tax=Mycena chlorophos TaxID=658473 RepID=A0A8H6W4F7_MYCCL|nr:hypothetical protein HMN09_00785800 [Mycena chlorophos]
MRIPFSVILCAILCVPALAAPALGDRESMALERRATKAKAATHAVAKAPAPKKAVPKKVKPAKAPAKKPAAKPAKAPAAKKPAAAPAKKPATAPAKKTTKSTAAKTPTKAPPAKKPTSASKPAKAPAKSSAAKSPAKASSPKSCALPAKKGATKSKLTGRNDDDEFCAEFTECGCKGCIDNTAGVCGFNTATNTCVSLNSPGPATLISNAEECPATPATAPPAQAPAPAANTDPRVVTAAKKFFSKSVQDHIFIGPKKPTTTGRHLKSVWLKDNSGSPLIDNNAQTGLSSFNFAEGNSKIKTVFNDQDGPVKYSKADVSALCLRAYELSIEAAAKKSGALSNTAGKSSQKTLTLSPRETTKEGGKTLLVGFVVHDAKINANICMAVNEDSCFPLGTTPVPNSTEGQKCTVELDAQSVPPLHRNEFGGDVPHSAPYRIDLDVGYSPIRHTGTGAVAEFLLAVLGDINPLHASGEWEGDERAGRYYERWKRVSRLVRRMAQKAKRPLSPLDTDSESESEDDD